MKRILLWAGLVVAAVLIACGNTGVSTPSGTYDEKTEVTDDISTRYTEETIKEARIRETFTSKLPKIQDASSFGKKRAEIVWRAFVAENFGIKESGTVTITYYDEGVQITRNNSSWFYDGIKYDGMSTLYHVTAVESVLHPGVWEPAYLELAIGSRPDLEFHFLYKGTCKEDHWLLLMAFQAKKLKINSNSDMQISVKEF